MSLLTSPARRIRPGLVTKLFILAFGNLCVLGVGVIEGVGATFVIRDLVRFCGTRASVVEGLRETLVGAVMPEQLEPW
jgi:hypothetical protein